jgi:hypothetical protein
MNDKLIAGVVTMAAIAPLCAICVLGLTFVGSLLTAALGWFMGLGFFATVALLIAVGILFYWARFWKRSRGRRNIMGKYHSEPIRPARK